MGTASTQDLRVGDPPPDEKPKVGQSPLHPRRGTRSSEEFRIANHRRRSGTATSPPSNPTSSVFGIVSLARDKPLLDINVEDITDPVAKKRASNTLAARNYRERKIQRVHELEERVARLEEERDHWKSIALEGIRNNNG